MAEKLMGTVTIENARILFRNFAGGPTRFNPDNKKRTFNVIIPPELVEPMLRDGWNIKWLQPRLDEFGKQINPDDEPAPKLEVQVKYLGRNGPVKPPRVIMITSRGRTALDASTIDLLDTAEIENVDVILRPYSYDVNGSQGISAYLQTMFVTIREDELERKYNELPDDDTQPIRRRFLPDDER